MNRSHFAKAARQLDYLASRNEAPSRMTFDADKDFAEFIPMVIQRTTTDADAKFSLSYPRDKNFALFAKAERLVDDKKGTYFWLVNAPSGIEKAQSFLSNNNLVMVDPDGYFKIKPKSELQESAP